LGRTVVQSREGKTDVQAEQRKTYKIKDMKSGLGSKKHIEIKNTLRERECWESKPLHLTHQTCEGVHLAHHVRSSKKPSSPTENLESRKGVGEKKVY